MKITTKQREEKDGRLKLEWRFSCERPAPRGENPHYDVEADMARTAVDELLTDAHGMPRGLRGQMGPYIIATREYVGPNHRESRNDMELILRPDNGEGWPGNSDTGPFSEAPYAPCYHGWRGTTDDWAIYAQGLRRVLDVRVTGQRSKRVVVVLGRDLAEDRP